MKDLPQFSLLGLGATVVLVGCAAKKPEGKLCVSVQFGAPKSKNPSQFVPQSVEIDILRAGKTINVAKFPRFGKGDSVASEILTLSEGDYTLHALAFPPGRSNDGTLLDSRRVKIGAGPMPVATFSCR